MNNPSTGTDDSILETVTLDNVTYDFTALSDNAKSIALDIANADAAIQQLEISTKLAIIGREKLVEELKKALSDASPSFG